MVIGERLKVLDQFTSARPTTPQEGFQLRVIAGGALLGAVVSAVSAATQLILSIPGPAIVVGAFGAGCIALLIVIRAGASTGAVRRLGLLLLGMFFVVESLQTVELDWAQFKWLVLLPMLSLFLSDAKADEGASRRRIVSLWRGTGMAVLLAGLIMVANHLGWTAGAHTRNDDWGGMPFDSLIDFALFAVSVAGLTSIHTLALRKMEEEVSMLRSLLAICAWCRRIRDAEEGWMVLERYMAKHSSAMLTHGMCPDCAEKVSAELP